MAKDKEAAELTQEDLVALVAAKDKELEDAYGLIEELKAELAKQSEAAQTVGGKPTVKVGKDTYEVVIGAFRHKGESYTGADVLKNDALAAALVKKGSGVLRKVEKK